MKNLLLLLFTLYPVICFSQCPDANSNKYKQKAEQYGDVSYTTLATYYYYKCQCENGIANRTRAQVNALVDQYNGLKSHGNGSSGIEIEGQHKVQWANIKKEYSKCSKASNQKNINNGDGTSTQISAKEQKEIKNQEYLAKTSSASIALINKDYESATLQFAKQGINGIASGNERDFYTGVIGTTISFIAQDAERRRLEKLEKERKKKAFYKLVNNYRTDVYDLIRKRRKFFYEKEKSTTFLDGSNFKPIYIYFAYAKNDFSFIQEEIEFPNKINIYFNKESTIYFSQVYGVYPHFNGEYPSMSTIKHDILTHHFNKSKEDYSVVFFPWENSLNNLIENLQNNLEKSVIENSFTLAKPSQEKEIKFILRKNTNDKSRDYWNGGKIKPKESKKINYWKNKL